MKWQNHMIIGASFGAVINPLIIPVAVLGSTAPDWLEYILKICGYRVKHRTVTHVLLYWLAAIAFFKLVIAGVPFSPTSDARFHLFVGKLRTGNAGEYVVAGIIALLCAGWVHLSPASFKNAPTAETSGFLPFFYDWKKEFEIYLKYVYCAYMKITFDPIKNKTNRLKHRVDLTDVEGVFYDDHAIMIEDKDHTEERFVTLGVDGFGRLLVVTYHYRNEDIRIISARQAEPHERRAYEEG